MRKLEHLFVDYLYDIRHNCRVELLRINFYTDASLINAELDIIPSYIITKLLLGAH